MKNSFTASSSTERLMEDELYALVYEEIETGQMDKSAQSAASRSDCAEIFRDRVTDDTVAAQ